MGVRDGELTRVETFTGLNNRDREPLARGNVLRDAVDVDLTKLGKIQTRRGYGAPLVPCTLGHSLWADPESLFPFGLYADEDGLYELGADLSTRLIRSGLSVGLDLSYARVNDSVFWSNGAESGMVDAVGQPAPWSCEQPSGQPALAAVDGALGAGLVQVAITFADLRGRESGATLAADIVLAPGQGVQLLGIPQPNDPVETPQVRIYVTGGDDRALYHAKNVPAGTISTTVIQPPEGRLLATQFLQPMPAGHIVRQWNGRQLVARGRYVLWSPALRYGLTHIGHMHLGLRERLTLMEPIDGDGSGVYVSDGARVLFLSGADPANWAPKPVSAYGAVAGSAMLTPASAWGIGSKRWIPAWLGTDGLFAVGLPGGTVTTFNQSEFVAGIGDRAASLFRKADGLMQFITAQRGLSKPRLAVADEAVATVFREDGSQV
ncbi:MAG: hypothetical protein KA775_04430 [Ottowia sp.]|nr:hypothetical protein [Ottowia sp.]